MKLIKRGIKVWVLGDGHNGYFHKFQIYSGKEGTQKVNLGARVVKTLTNHLRGKFHLIFFNNFFTSLKLLEDLEVDGLHGCGTVRKHRIGFPPTLKTLKLTSRYNTFKYYNSSGHSSLLQTTVQLCPPQTVIAYT